MESTLVSARMSRAKKERASDILASIGATTSDLINCAFDYVISTKELPLAKHAEKRDIRGFESFREKSTIAVDWPESFDGNYKSMMADLRRADYEALD